MTTPREKFVALLNRFNAARGDDLTEAHAAVLQAYDEAAGREGQPVAWCIRAYGTLFYHEGGTDKAGVESNLRRNWDREVEDGDAELVAFYERPAPKSDAAADWVCVPRESTWDMRKAAKAAGIFDPRVAEATWNAMIAAAPKP